ncbi:Uncharacterized protein ALO57_01049 [Pseudomonas coronafaciens pv. oryzae]|uniref:hypothetical protein n=1 Tax=Pseudomonas coronafaciens TaxID=53409 RepID=UPI0006B51904|nr:hypothetical protein [Pseudomonas coronafaciens]KPB54727.1 Uncharacterized protein AC511_3437 [Pseudomonas coronafaciens pv. oryzae]KPY05471.1 Uncharacterized protein ALO57_01049 [Pseudomonas coronafaciens pv. oryzae]RMT01081.1 hypothetical protein ALP55_02442 [Pseudomonas coronafaciens pv. oryzae]
MQQLDFAVPYVERCVNTLSGTSVVWPFLNAEKDAGPYELFLDTNALINVDWASQLPVEIRLQSILNPLPALLEQWLSNPELRKKPIPQIEEMIQRLAKLGFIFRRNFVQDQVALLQKNEAALRTQFSLIFPYVAIMKSLLSKKTPVDVAIAQLDSLGQADIPRFTSCLMLTALGVVLKSRQALKLDGDTKPAYSYMESFLAFQPGKKDEIDRMTIPYLRNRAGDLNLWLTLPALREQRYSFVGTPAVVTGDKALHRLILRVLPPLLHESQRTCFTIYSEGLEESLGTKIEQVVKSVEIRSRGTEKEIAQRAFTLFELAKEFCAKPEERLVLDEAWQQWCLPGLGLAIELV